MAYNLSVHAKKDGAPRCELFHRHLGAENTVFTYWHLPACDLKLPLLSQIYHEGLEVAGDQLDELASELQALEQHWLETEAGTSQQIPHKVTDKNGRVSTEYVSLSVHLKERAGSVREAIHIARDSNGVIEIS